jgi:hypothetical protein
VHRLDPRTKLLLGFQFLIMTVTVDSFRGLAPARNVRRPDLHRVPGPGSSRPVIEGASAADRSAGRSAQPVFRPDRAHSVPARVLAEKRGLAAFRSLYGAPPDLDDGRYERYHAQPHRRMDPQLRALSACSRRVRAWDFPRTSPA